MDSGDSKSNKLIVLVMAMFFIYIERYTTPARTWFLKKSKQIPYGTMSTFKLVICQLSRNINRREVPCRVKDIFKRETY